MLTFIHSYKLLMFFFACIFYQLVYFYSNLFTISILFTEKIELSIAKFIIQIMYSILSKCVIQLLVFISTLNIVLCAMSLDTISEPVNITIHPDFNRDCSKFKNFTESQPNESIKIVASHYHSY